METVSVLAFFAPVVAFLRRVFAKVLVHRLVCEFCGACGAWRGSEREARSWGKAHGWAFSVSGALCPVCCVGLRVESARERERKAAREREHERRAGPPKCPRCGADLTPWEVEGEPCDRCADGGGR